MKPCWTEYILAPCEIFHRKEYSMICSKVNIYSINIPKNVRWQFNIKLKTVYFM